MKTKKQANRTYLTLEILKENIFQSKLNRYRTHKDYFQKSDRCYETMLQKITCDCG